MVDTKFLGCIPSKWDNRNLMYAVRAPSYSEVQTIPDEYTELKSYLECLGNQGNIGCYSSDTEVLTLEGWKPFRDATLNDEIATLSMDGLIEYQHPIRKFVSRYSGEMLTVKKNGFNLSVTPNHNMLVRKWDGSNRKLSTFLSSVRADELGWFSAVPRTGKWRGIDREYFEIGKKTNKVHEINYKILMDDWLWFLGIYIAEGCCVRYNTNYPEYRIEIAAVNPKKRLIIEDHMSRLPWRFTSCADRFKIWNQNLWQILQPLGQALQKYIPGYVKTLPPNRIQSFLDGFATGDGGETNGQLRLYTSSKRLADDLQELIFKTGKVANLSSRPPKKSMIRGRIINGGESYCLIIKNRIHTDIERTKGDVVIEDYSDNVYCFEVPNHTMYVRLKGTPYWCGNSCTGWAGAGLMKSLIALNDKRSVFPSAGWVYWKGRDYCEPPLNPDAEGSYPIAVMKLLQKEGATTEECSPTDTVSPFKLEECLESKTIASLYKIGSYHQVNPDPASMKAAIYGITYNQPYIMPDGSQGKSPLYIAIPVYIGLYIAVKGVVEMPKDGDALYGYHAVLIAGWKKIADEDYWIIVNSWGTENGDNGYYYLPVGYPITEAWLVTDDAPIPNDNPIPPPEPVPPEPSPVPEPTPTPTPTPSKCRWGKGAASVLNIYPRVMKRRGRFYYLNPKDGKV